MLTAAVSTRVSATSPYTEGTNARTYRASDHVYTEQHGSTSVLKITGGSLTTRLTGRITFAVDTSKSHQRSAEADVEQQR